MKKIRDTAQIARDVQALTALTAGAEKLLTVFENQYSLLQKSVSGSPPDLPGLPAESLAGISPEEMCRVVEKVSVLARRFEALTALGAANIADFYLLAELDAEYHYSQIHGSSDTDGDVQARAQAESQLLAAAEISCLSRSSEHYARKLLTIAEGLDELPSTTRAFWQGSLTLAQAERITSGADGLSGQDLAGYDHDLAQFFSNTTKIVGQSAIKTKIRRTRAHYGVRDQEKRRREALEQRGVWIEPEEDGVATLMAKLPAPEVYAVYNTVTDISHTAKHNGDKRGLDQLRADTLVALFLTSPATLQQLQVQLELQALLPNQPLSTAGTGLDNANPHGTASGRLKDQNGAPHIDLKGMDLKDMPAIPLDRDDLWSISPGSADVPRNSFLRGTVPNYTQSNPAAVDAADKAKPTNMATRADEPNSVNSADVENSVDIEPVGARAVIHVYIPTSTLFGVDEEPAVLAGYGPISAQAARELASQADTLHRIVTDAATGVPLAQGQKSYAVSAQTRQFLRQLTETCEFPTCNKSASHTDADHIVPWAEGGETNPENLQLLCRKHHNLKTRRRWHASRNSDGTTTWTSPLGNSYTTEHQFPTLSPPVAPQTESEPPF